MFDLTNTTEFVLKNNVFEKYGCNLDFEISLPLNISTDKDLIILSTQFEDIDFIETVDTGKIDDGIKKITTAIFEYITNKDSWSEGHHIDLTLLVLKPALSIPVGFASDFRNFKAEILFVANDLI